MKANDANGAPPRGSESTWPADGVPPPPYGYGPHGYLPPGGPPKKRKWLSLLLAFCFPGLGHMYLGMMVRGIVLMMLLAMDICGIVYFAISGPPNSVLVIVMLSLFIPILYAFNIFDALQKTDTVNERAAAFAQAARGNGQPPSPGGPSQPVTAFGVLLLVAGGIALFSTAHAEWTSRLLRSSGSMAGAIVLLAIGAAVWLWERRGSSDKRD